MTSQLRDLAARIEDVARQHPTYSQAWQPVRTLVDHLSALAGMEEANQGQFKPVKPLLLAVREKLQLYRARRGSEYVGGVEFSELIRRIDEATRP